MTGHAKAFAGWRDPTWNSAGAGHGSLPAGDGKLQVAGYSGKVLGAGRGRNGIVEEAGDLRRSRQSERSLSYGIYR